MRGAGADLGGDVPRCGNCDAFLRNKDLQVKLGFPAQGWCRANPPALVQVMMPGPQPGQVAPGFQGMFTPTASDCWCRQWRSDRMIEVNLPDIGVPHAADTKPAA